MNQNNNDNEITNYISSNKSCLRKKSKHIEEIKYKLSPKDEEKEEVVPSTQNRNFSEDFKDLVLSLMSYHFYDRLTIE